jgi:thioredoxin 1
MSQHLPAKNAPASTSWQRTALASVRRLVSLDTPAKMDAQPAPALTRIASETALLSIVATPEPSLVLFDAGWRGPGQALHDLLAEIAREYPLVAAWVDVDSLPAVPARYGVKGVPTLMLFRGGQVISSRMGETRASEIEAWLGQNLSDEEAR